MNAAPNDSLLRQTLRSTAILVGACVVFVGSLSVMAVVVTNRATSPRGTDSVDVHESSAPATAKDSAKKPLSI